MNSRMRRSVTFFAVAVLSSGCAAYKVEPVSELRSLPMTADNDAALVTRLDEFPEGNHCFEPMLYVLTLGIIPTHCVQRYHVSQTDVSDRDKSSLDTHFAVTLVQGWVALALPLSHRWRFGFGTEAPADIEQLVLQESR